MAQTGHRSTEMVRHYIREGSLFETAAALVGSKWPDVDRQPIRSMAEPWITR